MSNAQMLVRETFVKDLVKVNEKITGEEIQKALIARFGIGMRLTRMYKLKDQALEELYHAQ